MTEERLEELRMLYRHDAPEKDIEELCEEVESQAALNWTRSVQLGELKTQVERLQAELQALQEGVTVDEARLRVPEGCRATIENYGKGLVITIYSNAERTRSPIILHPLPKTPESQEGEDF